MSEITLDNDLLKQLQAEEEEQFPPVQTDHDYSNVIVITGLPIVTREREGKLVGLIQKLLSAITVESTKEPVSMKEWYMPFQGEQSKGYAFVEYQKSSHAVAVKQKMNGYKLTTKNIFKVFRYEDWERLDDIPDTFVPPEEKEYIPPDDLQSWLYSEQSLDGKDQYVIRFGDSTEVHWHSEGNSELEVGRKKWTDNCDWSPKGTYLVTFLPLGVLLIGGPEWTKQRSFKHQSVTRVQFSPCERFLVTWSPTLATNETSENPQSIIVWEIKTSKPLRSFTTLPQLVWPAFKWSHDGKYLSRLNEGLIFVYETETMSLITDKTGQKLPIKLHGPTFEHSWSPTDPYLAVFVPEHKNIPARVMLLEIPSREVMSQQSLVNVKMCHLHWQEPNGNFLGAKVDRRNKKQTFTAFEFFRVREKNIPVEGLELKDNVIAFAWETTGSRFAIIHADSPSSSRPNVSFYSMEGGSFKHLKTLEKRQANHVFWAPTGRYVVLAGLRNMNQQLEFFDADTLETLAQVQHSMCTDIQWDPTGRYLVSYVSHYRCKNENGFKIWSFRGVELLGIDKDIFWQFLWRPRPPSLLPTEKIQWLKVPKNFQEFQRKYREKDKKEQLEREERRNAEREALRQNYRNWQIRRRTEWKGHSEWRKKFGIIDDDEEDFYIVEECVEEVIKTETVVMN